MKQHIHLAAMVLRDGRLWLLREHPAAPWELPGGPLPLDNDDVDAEMDAILQRFGVNAPAVEEDFVETIHLPHEGGQMICNLYAPSDWAGEPTAQPGVGSGWFAVDELEAIEMHSVVRDAILVAFGLKQPADRSADFVAALNAQFGAEFSLAAAGSSGAGMPEGLATVDLDARTRSLVSVAVLVALGRRELLAAHVDDALAAGASPSDLAAAFHLAGEFAGDAAAIAAWPELDHALAARGLAPLGSPR